MTHSGCRHFLHNIESKYILIDISLLLVYLAVKFKGQLKTTSHVKDLILLSGLSRLYDLWNYHRRPLLHNCIHLIHHVVNVTSWKSIMYNRFLTIWNFNDFFSIGISASMSGKGILTGMPDYCDGWGYSFYRPWDWCQDKDNHTQWPTETQNNHNYCSKLITMSRSWVVYLELYITALFSPQLSNQQVSTFYST